MPRPYGKPLIAVLEALATDHPATAAQIRQRLPLDLQAKTAHACHWAVTYELMNAHGTARPRMYSVAPDWRERVAQRQAEAGRAAPLPYTVRPAPPPVHMVAVVTVAAALANRSPLEVAWQNCR